MILSKRLSFFNSAHVIIGQYQIYLLIYLFLIPFAIFLWHIDVLILVLNDLSFHILICIFDKLLMHQEFAHILVGVNHDLIIIVYLINVFRLFYL